MQQSNFIKKNLKYSALNYIVINVLKFIVRMVFVRTLSVDLLGVNGLFSNILTMLSLAELGIGPAIVFSLYKPLAVRDTEKIKGIMNFFKKVYVTIGIVIFVAGLALCPFLDFFVSKKSHLDNLQWYYLFFLVNTSISYFWSYNRNLLIADQKQFLINHYQMLVQIGVNLAQMVLLLLTHSYYSFLLVMAMGTIIENYTISSRALKEYDFLKNNDVAIDKTTKSGILKNTRAMIFHKVAGMIVFSTSNIIISKYLGLAMVGIYSNYYMVINALNALAGKFFESVTASIGNIVALDNEADKIKSFRIAEFTTAYQASCASVGLISVLDVFVSIWVGKEYLLDRITVVLIVVLFYLTYMRKAVLMFRDACGLFWFDRYKAVVEAVINFVAAVYLAQSYGIKGVVLAGIISTILTCFWVEPYVLFRYGIRYSLTRYFKEYAQYTLCTLAAVALFSAICQSLSITSSLLRFVVNGVIAVSVSIFVWHMAFRNDEVYQMGFNKVVRRIKR